MISHTTKAFRQLLLDLPKVQKRQSQSAYRQFKADPYHPSLNFKRVHSKRLMYSVRISKNYRAVGILSENEIVWFWIGKHSEYEKILKIN